MNLIGSNLINNFDVCSESSKTCPIISECKNIGDGIL